MFITNFEVNNELLGYISKGRSWKMAKKQIKNFHNSVFIDHRFVPFRFNEWFWVWYDNELITNSLLFNKGIKIQGVLVLMTNDYVNNECHGYKAIQGIFAQYPWWRHPMETFSALLALCAGNSPVPVNSPHKGQWRRALMFSLICVWINDWVNNHEAGDLRRYRGHYDVSVMSVVNNNEKSKKRKSITQLLIITALCYLFGDIISWQRKSNYLEIDGIVWDAISNNVYRRSHSLVPIV